MTGAHAAAKSSTVPFVQARNYHPGRIRPVRVVVIHDMESPERPTTAEDCARYFAGPNAPEASAHDCIDNDSVVQCVRDTDTAWAAPGANSDGTGNQIQVQLFTGTGDVSYAQHTVYDLTAMGVTDAAGNLV